MAIRRSLEAAFLQSLQSVVTHQPSHPVFANGQASIASLIDNSNPGRIKNRDFEEIYDPRMAEFCGAEAFIRASAIVVEILNTSQQAAA